LRRDREAVGGVHRQEGREGGGVRTNRTDPVSRKKQQQNRAAFLEGVAVLMASPAPMHLFRKEMSNGLATG
jgi:hypothetical protein